MIGSGNLPLSKKSRLVIPLLLLTSLIISSCQPAAAPAAPAPTLAPPTTAPTSVPPTATEAAPAVTEAPTSPPAAAVSEPAINVVQDPKYGPILVDAKGMTLYIFTKDEPDKSNCNPDCLVKWPPLLTLGSPVLGEGVDPAMVGSAALSDGTQIVTYNHLPLYYWWKDLKAGDTDGQGVGDVWFVINPAGEMIKAEVSSSLASPAAADATEASINVADDPVLGPILVDGKGMTLYMFTKDEPDKSNCNPDCLVKWPPLLTQGSPTLGEGVDPALVGSAALADGTLIVTYNHMPLYYWWKDLKAGDTDGQGVGEVWYVVAPDGSVIKGPPAALLIPQVTVQSMQKKEKSGGGDY